MKRSATALKHPPPIPERSEPPAEHLRRKHTKAAQTRANSKTLVNSVKDLSLPKKPGSRVIDDVRHPGWLPPIVTRQCTVAQRAFVLLCAKPARSLRSIAQELGCSAGSLHGYSKAGDWPRQLALHFYRDAETLHIEQKAEAHRSRAELIASNPLREAAMQAALAAMVLVDDVGNVTLKPGVDIQDVQRLQMAMANHIKVTMLLTGEEQALRRGVAQAAQAKVVINMRDVNPEPVPISGEIVR